MERPARARHEVLGGALTLYCRSLRGPELFMDALPGHMISPLEICAALSCPCASPLDNGITSQHVFPGSHTSASCDVRQAEISSPLLILQVV